MKTSRLAAVSILLYLAFISAAMPAAASPKDWLPGVYWGMPIEELLKVRPTSISSDRLKPSAPIDVSIWRQTLYEQLNDNAYFTNATYEVDHGRVFTIWMQGRHDKAEYERLKSKLLKEALQKFGSPNALLVSDRTGRQGPVLFWQDLFFYTGLSFARGINKREQGVFHYAISSAGYKGSHPGFWLSKPVSKKESDALLAPVKKEIEKILPGAFAGPPKGGYPLWAEARVDVFSVRATIGRSPILPFEPVSVMVTLRNESSEVESREGTWGGGIYLETNDYTPWRQYFNIKTMTSLPQKRSMTRYAALYNYAGGRALPPPLPHARTFTPGEEVTYFYTIDVNMERQHVFRKPGLYRIRGTVDKYKSPPVTIVVNRPEKADAQAYYYLELYPLYRYFTDDSAYMYVGMYYLQDPQASAKLREFIARFPNSRYSAWARLGLLFIKKHEAGYRPKDWGDVQKEMEALAPTLPSPVKSWCWFEAGRIAAARKDRAAATADFDQALAAGGDTTMKERTSSILQWQDWTP